MRNRKDFIEYRFEDVRTLAHVLAKGQELSSKHSENILRRVKP